MSRVRDLTVGSVRRSLLAFALPFFFANLLQALYGATDLMVVGRFTGTSAIAAVNIGTQVMQTMTGLITGCAVGVTVLIGRCIGAKNGSAASRAMGNTTVAFAALAAAFTPLMFAFAEPIAHLMATPDAAMDETVSYIRVCSLGIPFIVLFNVTAAVLRGMGDSRAPLYAVGVACAVNIAGDLLLSGVFRLGAVGVAAATATSQALSSLFGLLMLRRGFPFRVTRRDLAPHRATILSIAKVGVPIAVQDMLIGLSFLVLTRVANARGLVASSAVGVVEKVILFLFLVPGAMLSAISAITAQNIGAGKPERARESLVVGTIVTTGFGAVMCALSWIAPDFLNGLFTRDESVILAAGQYLRTYSIDCILVGVTFCVNGYLCGIGKSFVTFVHNVLAILIARVPAAYLLSRAFPESLLPMGLASPLGSLCSILILAVYFLNQKKKGTPAI